MLPQRMHFLAYLLVLATPLSISAFNDKLCGEDVSQLSTVAVPASCGLLLRVVIVAAGKQVSKH